MPAYSAVSGHFPLPSGRLGEIVTGLLLWPARGGGSSPIGAED